MRSWLSQCEVLQYLLAVLAKRRSEDSVFGSICTDRFRLVRLMLADVSWSGFPLHLMDRELWLGLVFDSSEQVQSLLPLLFAIHVQASHLSSLRSGGLEEHTSIPTLPTCLWDLSASFWSAVCSRCC